MLVLPCGRRLANCFCETDAREPNQVMTTEGFGQAYSRGFDVTIRFLTSRGLRRDHACEVAQAAWVKGWERLGQLRDERFVFTWVNTIALNVYRKAIRTDPLS